jgi:hypothetical protein
MKFENHTVERVNADDFWRLDAELKELEHAPRPAPLQLQEGSRGMEQVEEQAAYPEVLAAHYNTGGFPHVWVKELDGSWTFTPVGPGPGDIIIRRKDG